MCMQAVLMGSSVLQAGAQLAQGFSDASGARANAKMAIHEGKSALVAANLEAGRMRYSGERFLGEIRSQQAASGVDLSSGTAAEVGAESAANIQRDVDLALYRGRLTNWAKVSEAKILKKQAQASQFNSILGAGSTILGGAGKAYG
jgi:hypothetical protein